MASIIEYRWRMQARKGYCAPGDNQMDWRSWRVFEWFGPRFATIEEGQGWYVGKYGSCFPHEILPGKSKRSMTLTRYEEPKMADTKAAAPNPKQAFGDKKPRLTLLPLSAQLAAQEAHLDGALKYGEQNWRENPVEAMTYIDAAIRHLRLFENGEDLARDTTVQNLGAVIACCNILIDSMAHGTMIDNRRPSKAACDLLHGRGETMVQHLKEMQVKRLQDAAPKPEHPWIEHRGVLPNLRGYRWVELRYHPINDYIDITKTSKVVVSPTAVSYGIDWYGVSHWRKADGKD